MAQFQRHFTIDEARALLPELRERFMEIGKLVARIRAVQIHNHEERLKILRGNGKGPVLEGANPLIAEVQTHIDAIVKQGIQIKDLETGLIDFPHYLDGRDDLEVFLCYQMSESDIGFWHAIEDGYSGRHPL
jgi:hypothetical protein